MAQQAQTVALPKRWPMVIEPENRNDDTTLDAKLINAYVEVKGTPTEREYWVTKRAGYAVDATHSSTGNGYGTYNWKNDIYAVFGTTLYKNGSSYGTVDATGGVYRFDQLLGGTPRLVLGNGVKAYYTDGTTLSTITDVDFPAAFVKGWTYLDGVLYVFKANANLQGSAANDPSSWDPLNVLVAQIEPDAGVALAKQLVYAVALKEWSTEIFYDAGNATASPLGPVQGAKINYGCASADSVQNIDDSLIWLGSTRAASLQVILMQGLKVDIVSTKPIERLLDHADLTTVYSFQFKDEGHSFYVLTIKNNNLTLVYDLREKAWSQWTDANGNYFPIVSSTYDSSRRHLWQHESNGKMYYADRDTTNDDGSTITVDIYTPNYDADTRRRKTLNMMLFSADQIAGSTMTARFNDNDYDSGSWSTPRTVNLANKQPMLANNGTFIRRAYNFRHAADTRFRLKAVDLQMDLGTL